MGGNAHHAAIGGETNALQPRTVSIATSVRLPMPEQGARLTSRLPKRDCKTLNLIRLDPPPILPMGACRRASQLMTRLQHWRRSLPSSRPRRLRRPRKSQSLRSRQLRLELEAMPQASLATTVRQPLTMTSRATWCCQRRQAQSPFMLGRHSSVIDPMHPNAAIGFLSEDRSYIPHPLSI